MKGIEKYLKNGVWILLERLVSSLGVIFITIYTARYLGPEQMGVINYALSIGAILSVISQFGSQALFFDKSIRNSLKGMKLIVSSQSFRVIIYTILFVIIVFTFFYFNLLEDDNFIVFVAVLFSSCFTALDSFKPYLEATLKAKISSLYGQFGLLVGFLLRFVLIHFSFSFIYFFVPYVLQGGVTFLLRLKKFKEYRDAVLEPEFKRKKEYKTFSIKAGIPLMLSSLSVVLYLKIGQIFLANFAGVSDLGIYNAGVTIGQGWSFLPIALATVAMTKVLKEKKAERLQAGFSFIIFIIVLTSSSVISIIIIFRETFLLLTYGNNYAGAVDIIPLLCFASLFSSIGMVSSRLIIHKSGYSYLMAKTLVTCLVNVFLSYFLISNYGIYGAAVSILITEMLSSTIFNYSFRAGLIMRVQFKALGSYNYLRSVQ
jgi:O-antigen/teichoic acid export membrane protein